MKEINTPYKTSLSLGHRIGDRRQIYWAPFVCIDCGMRAEFDRRAGVHRGKILELACTGKESI